MGKPSRSDEVLTEEEQLRLTQQVQQLFEAAAPKRPQKPERSEANPFDALGSDSHYPGDVIPELSRLQQLKAQSVLLPVEGGVVSGDDYEENEYYKEFAPVVETEHHTTGTGYIKVEIAQNDCLKLDTNTVGVAKKAQFKCNPATNEWEPSPDLIFPVSDKPSRSDP
ncbi:hypothetical protein O6H91_07G040500 [Diphasiastrum complanatum]|uniref:Uncharacterized protein n=1 Tax=Diphasiastrum complanatum TaxID=34168 RepID=A0ACC2D4N9_DIPCM|nr:hypothetical protein O6H91_07G040500 [Diphasiastrum complanatum]